MCSKIALSTSRGGQSNGCLCGLTVAADNGNTPKGLKHLKNIY